jgi:hypothetical protein
MFQTCYGNVLLGRPERFDYRLTKILACRMGWSWREPCACVKSNQIGVACSTLVGNQSHGLHVRVIYLPFAGIGFP